MTGRKSLHTIITCKQNVALGLNRQLTLEWDFRIHPPPSQKKKQLKISTHCYEKWSLGRHCRPIETIPVLQSWGNYRFRAAMPKDGFCVNTVLIHRLWAGYAALSWLLHSARSHHPTYIPRSRKIHSLHGTFTWWINTTHFNTGSKGGTNWFISQ